MPIAASLLFVSLVAQGTASAPPTPPDIPVVAASQGAQGEPTGPPASAPTSRPHEVGLGGFGGSGGGPSFRYFFGERIGADLSVGWFRGPQGVTPSRGTTFQAAPSVVFMLNKSNVHADIDVRPYVGGGVNYLHNTTPLRSGSTGQVTRGGVGMQAFGGLELTFAGAPSIAISTEAIYHQLPVQTFNARLTRGTDFYLLFHYYMK